MAGFLRFWCYIAVCLSGGIFPLTVLRRLGYVCFVSNTGTIQAEQRKAVQVSLRPSIYAIATNLATEHGTFPGRIIERALMALVGKKGK